jgi:endonuclease/exonuclease/phosphatase family metal-dependent hydrolase
MNARVRLATFNLENLDDRPGAAPPLAARIAVLRPQLERLDADVLFLQEVNGQPAHGPRKLAALDALLDGVPAAGFHRVVTEGKHGWPMDRQNLVILSRWPIREHRQVLHDLVPPPELTDVTVLRDAGGPHPLHWDRPALCAAIELPGGQVLHAINLHLRAPLASFVEGQKLGAFSWRSSAGWAEGFWRAAVQRAGQAFEARLLVDAILDADPAALIAVAGDFNAEAAEMPTRILTARSEDTGNNALAGRSLVPVEAVVPAERRYSVIHAGRHLLLDHMLVSRRLAGCLVAAAIHNEALGDELVGYANRGDAVESFHAPLVVEFDVPSAD